MKLLFSNRSPLSVQLLTSILLALILIILDINYRPFNEVRYYLDSIVSQIHLELRLIHFMKWQKHEKS